MTVEWQEVNLKDNKEFQEALEQLIREHKGFRDCFKPLDLDVELLPKETEK